MNKTVLVVEDDQSLREAIAATIEITGFSVICVNDGYQAISVLNQKPIDMVISDIAMPGMDGKKLLLQMKSQFPLIPICMMTAFGDVADAIQSIRMGAVDYLVKPFEAKHLVQIISKQLVNASTLNNDVIAVAESTKQLFARAKLVAKSDASVMISGQSGTGKEVLARYIHLNSDRQQKPFVAINCAAIPENMLEATLFGYEKGAFTGALQAYAGKFEQAQSGTLLLDEITEMDLALQAKLLRVLQEREVERIGGKKLIKLDVRIISTTNRDILDSVAQGDFREDLYYRLNVFPLGTEKLSSRIDDILPIATHLLQSNAVKMRVTVDGFSEEAIEQLLHYEWPGNIRELDNVIQRSLVLKRGSYIQLEDLMLETRSLISAESEINKLKDQEYDMIASTLANHKGCRKKTAEQLGISPRSLRYKLAKMREAGMDIPT